jgi:hypothetical protein
MDNVLFHDACQIAHLTSLLGADAKASCNNFGAIGQFVDLRMSYSRATRCGSGFIYNALDEGIVVKECVRHSHYNGCVVGNDAANLQSQQHEQSAQKMKANISGVTLSTVSDMVLVSTTR